MYSHSGIGRIRNAFIIIAIHCVFDVDFAVGLYPALSNNSVNYFSVFMWQCSRSFVLAAARVWLA